MHTHHDHKHSHTHAHTHHTHTYDTHGNMTCSCAHQHEHAHSHDTSEGGCAGHDHSCSHRHDSGGHTHEGGGDDDEDSDSCCSHDHHSHNPFQSFPSYLPPAASFIMLLTGLAFSHLFKFSFFAGFIEFAWYALAYIPVGYPVLLSAIAAFKKGDYFTEFALMSIATVGAFSIGEYPEGVAVMLFYSVGEWFQERAVKTAKGNIKALLDVRPNTAHVLRDDAYTTVDPQTVAIGETIQVKVGEKIPLDGTLLSDKGVINTAAITGESKPQTAYCGDTVMAGTINLENVITVEVSKAFNDSSIARILSLVQDAASRKSKTELLIRKLAKIYTPTVAVLSVMICVLPALFVDDYIFSEWLYRALIFLVISCPCALVISIPLGYFGGLGAASQNGLLLKGAMFLDQLPKITTIAMDKTGTMTQGTFTIQDIIVSHSSYSTETFMAYVMALEAQSTHPIAKAILNHDTGATLHSVEEVREMAGKGLVGKVNGKTVIAGNSSLMREYAIETPPTDDIVSSVVMVAIDNIFTGYIVIADELKPDAKSAVAALRQLGVQKLVMLSGDKDSITQSVANELALDEAYGELMPEDKLAAIEKLKKETNGLVAFVGDGINDAPVLAASDVSMAMGGLGSDVAIETADVVIQSDAPAKIATAIRIGNSTRTIIWQNIALAFGVKALVLLLGALGIASMWGAVFSDVGVALLAILNAVRLQKMRWDS